MRLRELLSEVNPHNYDSDVDYYNALKHGNKKHEVDPDDYEPPARHPSQQDIEGDIAHQRQQKQHSTTEYVDKEGQAPNGKKYNKLFVIHAPNEVHALHQEHSFHKNEWGAKEVVDKHVKKEADGSVKIILFIVDNHKYGTWKPWNEQGVKESATAGATSSANIASVPNPNYANKANKKKVKSVNALNTKDVSIFGGPAFKR
jgi:hypothetical protein